MARAFDEVLHEEIVSPLLEHPAFQHHAVELQTRSGIQGIGEGFGYYDVIHEQLAFNMGVLGFMRDFLNVDKVHATP